MGKHCYFVGTSLIQSPVSTQFQALGAELIRRGHRVLIIAPPNECLPSLGSHGPDLLLWPSARPTHLLDALLLWRLIKQHRPDCLIANFAPVNWMCVIGWLRNVRCRVAWYHTLSSQITSDWRKPRFLLTLLRVRKRFVYSRATHIAANSTASLEDAHFVFGVPRYKCKVWRNCLPDPARSLKLTPSAEREKVIVCAGRFDKTKGQDVLVQALALCRDKLGPTKVEFLGQGPTLERVRSAGKRAHLLDRCSFPGLVPHDEVLARMARAMITVVPSRTEAFGLVNIESMSVATPVLASAVGGIPQIVRDTVDGFLVPPEDPATLADKLIHLLQNPDLRQSMGQHGRHRFLETYEQSKVITAQADWLERITSGESAPPRDGASRL